MHFYNLTVHRVTGVTHAIQGYFSGGNTEEILVSHGKSLELLRPDPSTGQVHTLLTVDVFGKIRSLKPFRIANGNKDFIVIGSDSGNIVILEYIPAKNVFMKVLQNAFGKAGCRRMVPGHHLAIDPKGRAIVIGGVEKQKLVYIFGKNEESQLTVSAPLEAHQKNTFVYDIIGVDLPYGNPLFAALEIDYEEADNDPTGEAGIKTQQMLTFYELELESKQVVKKYSEALEIHANFLVSIPDNCNSLRGVLIFAENYLMLKNLSDLADFRCPIPRRRNDLEDPERGMLFVCSATHCTSSLFFFLAQTEQGDLFKITVKTKGDVVLELKLKYFDTIPVATAICILKSGYLLAASEFGNHYLYQIVNLGDECDEPEFSSIMPLEEGDTLFFAPRPLRNLLLVDEIDSLSPIMSCHMPEFGDDSLPQLYVACGRGPRSTVRILQHGLDVTEIAVLELPGNPNAVWTIKRSMHDEYDAYIVVSFVNATLVLSVGETIEEVLDSGFLGITPTLSCSAFGDDAAVQVFPDGVKHIRSDKCLQDWKVQNQKQIVRCAVNQWQVVIALTGGELVYFEMDPTGLLKEYVQHKQMDSDVLCMSLGNAPSGEQMARFLVVGLADSTVAIVSLDLSSFLSVLKIQSIPDVAESICITEMETCEFINSVPGPSSSSMGNRISNLYLNIGLHNGMLFRCVLDSITGDMTDIRTRCLGSQPVNLFRIRIHQNEAVLAVSSRTWLCYFYQNLFYITPLSYECLEYASGFSSEQCPEGIVAISGNTLRILALEKLGTVFSQTVFPIKYTPRELIVHPDTSNFILIESDHNTFTEEVKQGRRIQIAEEMRDVAGDGEHELAQELAEAYLAEDLPESCFGSPKAGVGMWASLIRIMNPVDGKSHQIVRLLQNEAAISMCLCKFSGCENEEFLVVGMVQDLLLCPGQITEGYLLTYRLNAECTNLELVHRTPIGEIPRALCSFQGLLLVGAGRFLRLYGLGKKKLLRRCENKYIPNLIVSIVTKGLRICVCDAQESVYFVFYKYTVNRLVLFANDAQPRWINTALILDYSTVAIADKFGNIAVLRLPPNISEDVDEDLTSNKALWDRGLLNGLSQKADCIVNFHVGETVTSLQKGRLIADGTESLIYTTLSGTIGLLVPFTSQEEQDFLQQLENHMRSTNPSLCGNDHLSFRSYYYPIKNVVDGDLCDQFTSLDVDKQKNIAAELEKSTSDIVRKLQEIRINNSL